MSDDARTERINRLAAVFMKAEYTFVAKIQRQWRCHHFARLAKEEQTSSATAPSPAALGLHRAAAKANLPSVLSLLAAKA